MKELRNIGERRLRSSPNTFDDECYLASDITVDINEPINIGEVYFEEHSRE